MVTDRIIDVSSEPARLSIRYKQLVIENDGEEQTTIPVEDIATVVVSNPCVSYTHAVFSELAGKGATVVICDGKHLPAAMMIPLVANSTQTERFAIQAVTHIPVRKKLWQQVVKAKIRAQAKLLMDVRGEDMGLMAISRRVSSGDSENMEGTASRRYWPALFNDEAFVRRRDGPDQNRFLNYGYAVLRAITARAICASGLHPSLGLFHHNRYDPFCLADDLMEPYRPIVDRAVVAWMKDHDPFGEVNREVKQALIEPLTGRFVVDGECRTLFDLIGRTTSSLAAVYEGKRTSLALPEL